MQYCGKEKGVEKNFHFFQNNIIEEILVVTTLNKWPNLTPIVRKSEIIAYWKKSVRTIQYNTHSILIEKKKIIWKTKSNNKTKLKCKTFYKSTSSDSSN